jgi:uncharacterized protein YlzI (FlbEa/FlbD family)
LDGQIVGDGALHHRRAGARQHVGAVWVVVDPAEAREAYRFIKVLLWWKEWAMKFIRATRTNGARVLINIDYVAAMEHQDAETLNYTAIILQNGREIDVTESLDELLQQAEPHVEP